MTEFLAKLSSALTEAVDAAGASVVRVEGRRRLPASGIVWSADGLIVTASHVVERDEGIRVGLPGSKAVDAQLVGRDPGTDLALLRAPSNMGPPAIWADPEAPKVGMLALALGRPGQEVLATLGIISAVDEAWQTPAGGKLDRYLQTDAVMYPGFSGGPLIDVHHRLLGLNTSALLPDICLVVPFTTVRNTVETLLAHGRVRRGYLGVGAQPVQLPRGLSQQLGQDTGLLLMMVEPGGPAERGGLFQGDVLISLAGQSLGNMDGLLRALSDGAIGTRVPARIVRGGLVRDLTLVVAERPA